MCLRRCCIEDRASMRTAIASINYRISALISVEMLSFVAAVMMSLISFALLDVWSHVMLMSIFLHSLERLCCFYSSCCSLEMLALVVPCCHRMILMSSLILFAHFDTNKFCFSDSAFSFSVSVLFYFLIVLWRRKRSKDHSSLFSYFVFE